MTGPAGAGHTIFALSSGSLPAAIAVIRISGCEAGPALQSLAGRLSPARTATAMLLSDEAGQLLDRALVLWMPGPGSATGEDVAELHLHGGRATVAATLASLGRLPGLRAAEPGEFTRRALASGRLDLARVEGLADLLVAETEGQRRLALRLAEGGLGALVQRWRDRLLQLSARVEAGIEFAEEHEDASLSHGQVRHDAQAIAEELENMVRQPPAERLRDGVRIVLAGPVNAGKSTLLNALAGREAAITSPIEGTTRDLVEAPVTLDGMPCILVDSAGLRASGDPVEQIGVARARRAAADADVLLWLGLPADCPPHPACLVIHAQSDLRAPKEGADIAVSAITGSGLEELRACLSGLVRAALPADDQVGLHHRHRELLSGAALRLRDTAAETDELLVAEGLRSARAELDRVTGATGTEEMLDALFATFCIGK